MRSDVETIWAQMCAGYLDGVVYYVYFWIVFLFSGVLCHAPSHSVIRSVERVQDIVVHDVEPLGEFDMSLFAERLSRFKSILLHQGKHISRALIYEIEKEVDGLLGSDLSPHLRLYRAQLEILLFEARALVAGLALGTAVSDDAYLWASGPDIVGGSLAAVFHSVQDREDLDVYEDSLFTSSLHDSLDEEEEFLLDAETLVQAVRSDEINVSIVDAIVNTNQSLECLFSSYYGDRAARRDCIEARSKRRNEGSSDARSIKMQHAEPASSSLTEEDFSVSAQSLSKDLPASSEVLHPGSITSASDASLPSEVSLKVISRKLPSSSLPPSIEAGRIVLKKTGPSSLHQEMKTSDIDAPDPPETAVEEDLSIELERDISPQALHAEGAVAEDVEAKEADSGDSLPIASKPVMEKPDTLKTFPVRFTQKKRTAGAFRPRLSQAAFYTQKDFYARSHVTKPSYRHAPPRPGYMATPSRFILNDSFSYDAPLNGVLRFVSAVGLSNAAVQSEEESQCVPDDWTTCVRMPERAMRPSLDKQSRVPEESLPQESSPNVRRSDYSSSSHEKGEMKDKRTDSVGPNFSSPKSLGASRAKTSQPGNASRNKRNALTTKERSQPENRLSSQDSAKIPHSAQSCFDSLCTDALHADGDALRAEAFYTEEINKLSSRLDDLKAKRQKLLHDLSSRRSALLAGLNTLESLISGVEQKLLEIAQLIKALDTGGNEALASPKKNQAEAGAQLLNEKNEKRDDRVQVKKNLKVPAALSSTLLESKKMAPWSWEVPRRDLDNAFDF